MVVVAIMVGAKSIFFMLSVLTSLYFIWRTIGSLVLMHANIVKTGSGKADISWNHIWWVTALWTAFYFLSHVPL
jgi:hypothetical protein